MNLKKRFLFLLACLFSLGLGLPPAFADAIKPLVTPADPGAGPAKSMLIDAISIDLNKLPAEAQKTLGLIKKGGPFPYPKDGSVFGNYEKRLPVKPRGYYREYTVPSPGQRSRGARRIVAGIGPGKDVRTSHEYYYTDDHYQNFKRIRE